MENQIIIIALCALCVLPTESGFISKLQTSVQQPLYEHDGLQCGMCGPGKHVLGDCTVNNTLSTCATCPGGTFNPGFTHYRHCQECQICTLGKTILDQCTSTRNTKCSPCPDGYIEIPNENGAGSYCKKDDSEYWYIHKGLRCGKCGAGQYVLRDCVVNNTLATCSTCRPGSFNPRSTYSTDCIGCTVCTREKTILDECTTTTDTNCSSCPIGYIEKPNVQGAGSYCGKDYSQGTTLNTHTSDSPSLTKCPSNQYFNDSSNICHQCTSCKHILRPCNITHNAVCKDTTTTSLHDDSPNKLWYIMLAIVLAVILAVLVLVVKCCCLKSQNKNKLESIESKSAHIYLLESHGANVNNTEVPNTSETLVLHRTCCM